MSLIQRDQKNIIGIFKKHPQWGDVSDIILRLEEAGHTAYLAGGSVRDALLGLVPKDFDVATSARPEQVESLFAKTLDIGKKFGVILVIEKEIQVEVATFRTDGSYLDGRRPEHISYSSPEEDASRRDFTINALFFDIKTGAVLDYVGGEQDLQIKRIRCVGEPRKRFEEDKLRMLRAARFAVQLDFEIEKDTLSSIKENHKDLKAVSKERVTEEFRKILEANPERGLNLLGETGLILEVLKDWSLAKDPQALSELARHLKPGCELALALLVYAEVKRAQIDPKKLLERFSWPRSLNQFVISCLYIMDLLEKAQDDFLYELGQVKSSKQIEFIELVEKWCGPFDSKSRDLWQVFLQAYQSQGLPIESFLSGEDLKPLKLKGPDWGRVLKEAYIMQIRGQLKSRAEALVWVQGANQQRGRTPSE